MGWTQFWWLPFSHSQRHEKWAQSTGVERRREEERRGAAGWGAWLGIHGWVWDCLTSLSYLRTPSQLVTAQMGLPTASELPTVVFSPRPGVSPMPGSVSTPIPLRAPSIPAIPQNPRTSECSRQERPASLRRPQRTQEGRSHQPLGSQLLVAQSPSLPTPPILPAGV